MSALADGSVIVTGNFNGTATFGSTSLTSAGADDVFVAKVDASGSYVWAASAGGGLSDIGYGVSALADGSAVLTGRFQSRAVFGSTTLTSSAGIDMFVAKVDASGSFVWATSAGGSTNAWGNAVSTHADGSAVVTGLFDGTIAFGSTTFTAAVGTDAFIAKVGPSGSFVWARSVGGGGSNVGRDVSTLADGSAIVSGSFENTASLGSTTLTGAGILDVFVAKVDASGTFAWATGAGGTAWDIGYGVSALADGSAILTGLFQGTATFGSTTFTSAGAQDIFVAKVDSAGAFDWATSAGGNGIDLAEGVSALADGSAVVTGYFSGTAAFGSTTLTSAGSYDVFVAKFSSSAPASVPGAPTSPGAIAGDGQAAVSWSAPASDGGSPVTSYTVSAVEDPARTCTTPDGTTTTCTVTGLANGTSYTFTVTATNAVGTGAASAASAAVVPAGVPGAPSAPSTPPTNPVTAPVPGSAPADDAPASASPLPAPSTSAYTASGEAPAASGLAYSVRLLPSRTTLRAGQPMRLGVRIRSRYAIRSTARTSAALSGCVRLPSNLVIMRLPPGSLRSGQLVCWRLGGMAAGRQRTMVLTVRAASARPVSRSIEAWARERGVVVRERMRTSMRVRIQPRAPRVAVTG